MDTKIAGINHSEHRGFLFNSEERFHPELMRDLNVTEQYVRDGIDIILNWYKAQDHLPKYALDFDFIEGMFSNCKYSIEKTKKKLDCYLTVRNVMPEFFKNRDPTSEPVINGHTFTKCIAMPNLTPEGYRIVCIDFSGENAREFYKSENGLKILFMVSDMRMFYDQCASEIIIFDFGNLNFGHVSKLTPSVLRRAAFIFQHAYSHRIKAIHIVNLHKVALNMATIGKSFLIKKLSARMHFHENVQGLYNFVLPEYLPKQLGGTGGDFMEIFEKYHKTICTEPWRKWYTQSGDELVDESKRLVKDDRFDEFLGVSGTFRKLNLD